MSEQTQEPQFAIQRVYLKDVSFETPAGIEAFTRKWEPRIQLDVNTKTEKVADNSFEVVLSVTLTATQDDKPLLLIEVHQGGIFACKGMGDAQLRQVLSTRAPEVLFPYLRETVDALAVRGSFPPFMLAPINFDALFQQALQQAQAKQAAH
ncbi:MAG TPA: protein-export chaperone SecB [Pseudomonadales bacterium]